MSTGFRKSLLGFNQNDVIEYIKDLSAKAKKREDSLNKILEEAKKENEALNCVNKEITKKLADYDKKCNEINALCESISRVYLTSKISAKAIVDSANQNRKIIEEQIDGNISTIEQVQSALQKLKAQVSDTADNYNKEVDSVSSCLKTAKDVIDSNKKSAENAAKQFNEIII